MIPYCQKQVLVYKDKTPKPLVHFLADALKVTRRKAKALLDARCVFVNQRRIWMARHLVRSGDKVEIVMHAQPNRCASQELLILWDQNDLLAINKPSGIETTGTRSLQTLLQTQLGTSVRAIHRLDRETSGIVLFGRSDEVCELMQNQFKAHQVQKIYHALVFGCFPFQTKEVNQSIDGKKAMSRIKCVKSGRVVSYLECSILTGRRHQVRIHLSNLGYPVLGDKLYIRQDIIDPRLRAIARHLLHAFRVECRDPKDRTNIQITAPIPEDFKQVTSVFLSKSS